MSSCRWPTSPRPDRAVEGRRGTKPVLMEFLDVHAALRRVDDIAVPDLHDDVTFAVLISTAEIRSPAMTAAGKLT